MLPVLSFLWQPEGSQDSLSIAIIQIVKNNFMQWLYKFIDPGSPEMALLENGELFPTGISESGP